MLTNPENNSKPARSVCDMMYVDACDSNITLRGSSILSIHGFIRFLDKYY